MFRGWFGSYHRLSPLQGAPAQQFLQYPLHTGSGCQNGEKGILHMSEDLLREILGKANKNDTFRQLLIQAQERGVLIQVFANPHNLDEFIIGYVRSVGPDTCTIEEIRYSGEEDGNNSFLIRDVVEIAEDTRLLRRVALLREYADSIEEPEALDAEVADCFTSELERAQAQGEMVNCKISSLRDFRHVSGFVRDLSGGYVRIALITMEGDPDGIATIRISDIVSVYRNEKRQQAAMLFHSERDRLYPELL